MSAKFSSPLSEEDNAHQIGCISIYKLFNRNSFPAGQRGGKGGSSMRNINSDLLLSEQRKPVVMRSSQAPPVLPRSSYDECGSRAVVKVEETPRLSLDSRMSESKVSAHLQMESEKTIKRHRSSIVAKLMGLEEAFPSETESSTTTGSKKRDDSPITPKVRAQEASSSSSSVEKMITGVEFIRPSNKDLAAPKQMLESMRRANRRLEDQGKQRRQSSENQRSNHASESQNGNAYQQKPAPPAVRRACFRKHSDSNEATTAVPKGDQNKHRRENNNNSPLLSIKSRRKAKDIHREIGEQHSSMDKNSTLRRTSERERTSSGTSSPKLRSTTTTPLTTRRKKRHPKSDNLKEHSIDTRYSTGKADTDPARSESDASDASTMETEVESSFMPNSIITKIREQNCSRSNAESPPSAEQTSPVSVLDNTFYDEESEEEAIKGKNKWKNTEEEEKSKDQQGKIVVDMANEILIRKSTTGGGLYASRRSPETITEEEVVSSGVVAHRCGTSYWKTGDYGEDDGMMRLLVTWDVKYGSAEEDWSDFTGEVPYLVLDVERQIFKGLIDEVVSDEARRERASLLPMYYYY
ncbi:hypothetical protein M569_03660, partial [Genlisea aurea]